MKSVNLKLQSNGMMQLNPGGKPGPIPNGYDIEVINVPDDVMPLVVRDVINKTVVACPWDCYTWDWSDFGKGNLVNYYKKSVIGN